jgi:uncharacterized membrane protein YdjX (TVP38/TMEM64 family)
VNKKLLIIALAGLGLLAFLHFAPRGLFSLESLKAGQQAWQAEYHRSPALFLGGYFLIYVVMTAISFPGAAVMTLAGGAFFGVFVGTLLVSFASTIGATLAFLGSRYLFRDWVSARFGDRLTGLNAGMARDGSFYLFSLRLIPAIPFFVINLAMGLTPIPTWTYYWVSQVGMLLGTIVYVNAGTQLAEIGSLRDIASPGLIASFVALGLFPWVARWVVRLVQKKST